MFFKQLFYSEEKILCFNKTFEFLALSRCTKRVNVTCKGNIINLRNT